MNQIKYLGVSNGKVNNYLSCENCGSLEKGVKQFHNNGIDVCETCIKSDFSTEQIRKAILSKRTLSFGKRKASIKKFDYLMVRIDSPWGYQDVNFYFKKTDPLFDEFHKACSKQLEWKSEEYINAIKRVEYFFNDEVEELIKADGNYLCVNGYLASDNLVDKIITPSAVFFTEKELKVHKLEKITSFEDLFGVAFALYTKELRCLELFKVTN